jgi:hypothetical protein
MSHSDPQNRVNLYKAFWDCYLNLLSGLVSSCFQRFATSEMASEMRHGSIGTIWIEAVGRDEHGPLRTLVNGLIVHKGV